MKIIFFVIDQFHKKIRLTKERFQHVLEHPEMLSCEDRIKESLLIPEIIKESKYDKKVWVYYRFYEKSKVGGKYMAVVVKILNGEGFIITAYYTDKVKEGKTIWQR